MKNYLLKTEEGGFITAEDVIHRMYPTLCLIAEEMTGSMEEAEDKAGEALKEFLERKELFTGFAEVETFLRQKVYEDCQAFAKLKAMDKKLREDLQYMFAGQGNLEEEILNAEITRELDKLRHNLPPQQKKIFDYNCELEPVPTSWIARKLGIRKQTVRNTKNKTIKKLRKALKARGLIPVIILTAIGIVLYFLC
jgi:RNA polymerase sigma factor (sigma-70 family)